MTKRPYRAICLDVDGDHVLGTYSTPDAALKRIVDYAGGGGEWSGVWTVYTGFGSMATVEPQPIPDDELGEYAIGRIHKFLRRRLQWIEEGEAVNRSQAATFIQNLIEYYESLLPPDVQLRLIDAELSDEFYWALDAAAIAESEKTMEPPCQVFGYRPTGFAELTAKANKLQRRRDRIKRVHYGEGDCPVLALVDDLLTSRAPGGIEDVPF